MALNDDTGTVKRYQNMMMCSHTVQCACNRACCDNGVGQASTVFETEANHHIQQWYIEGATTHTSRVCQKGTLKTGAPSEDGVRCKLLHTHTQSRACCS